jgi:hypothetical protein
MQARIERLKIKKQNSERNELRQRIIAMAKEQRKWQRQQFSCTRSCEKWREGSTMWEAIVVDLQSRKSKPERVGLRTLQLINEIRPKLLKQGLLLIGVWTNLQTT